MKKQLKIFHLDYKKVVWGYFYVRAKDIAEARDLIDKGQEDGEYDNKSDYEVMGEVYEE